MNDVSMDVERLCLDLKHAGDVTVLRKIFESTGYGEYKFGQLDAGGVSLLRYLVCECSGDECFSAGALRLALQYEDVNRRHYHNGRADHCVLSCAIRGGKLNVVKALLEHGADSNATDGALRACADPVWVDQKSNAMAVPKSMLAIAAGVGAAMANLLISYGAVVDFAEVLESIDAGRADRLDVCAGIKIGPATEQSDFLTFARNFLVCGGDPAALVATIDTRLDALEKKVKKEMNAYTYDREDIVFIDRHGGVMDEKRSVVKSMRERERGHEHRRDPA